jgi:hypothetical protein
MWPCWSLYRELSGQVEVESLELIGVWTRRMYFFKGRYCCPTSFTALDVAVSRGREWSNHRTY